MRGLGLEVTLGKIVDDFEPAQSKKCSQESLPKTLEEEYQVMSVDKVEQADGVRILEIPAGDFVPQTRPLAAPIITSMTNGRNGSKPKMEMSQEPLIDDIDETGDQGETAENWVIRAPQSAMQSPEIVAQLALEADAFAVSDLNGVPALANQATPPADEKVKNMLDSFIEEQTREAFSGTGLDLSTLDLSNLDMLESLADQEALLGALNGSDQDDTDVSFAPPAVQTPQAPVQTPVIPVTAEQAAALPKEPQPVMMPPGNFGPLSMRINQRNAKNHPAPAVEEATEPAPAQVPAPAPMPFVPFPQASTPAPQAQTTLDSFAPVHSFEPSDEPDFDSIMSVQIVDASESESEFDVEDNSDAEVNADHSGDQPLVDFPSLTELKSLASELMSFNFADTRVGVGGRDNDKLANSSQNHAETTKTSD